MMRNTLALSALTILVTAAPAAAQSGHTHRGGADEPAAHRRVEASLAEFDRVVAEGHGFGLAFAADQNGYPGPLHVLELREALGLDPAQEAAMRALYERMLGRARPQAARLAAAEARLRRLFADSGADAAAVQAAVADAERARAELRLVHLLTHLEARDRLTEAQRQAYHALRWGAPKNQ
jgi:Spy/CpxP family protein refolding chaperone